MPETKNILRLCVMSRDRFICNQANKTLTHVIGTSQKSTSVNHGI
jgi:hypothetical protein